MANNADNPAMLEAFHQGEASMVLEGIRPADDPVYRSLKADVLAGKIDFDEAVAQAVESVERLVPSTAA